MCLVTTSNSICVIKHDPEPVLTINSHIFASSIFGKGNSLFFLLAKTTTIRAGDFISSAFFFES